MFADKGPRFPKNIVCSPCNSHFSTMEHNLLHFPLVYLVASTINQRGRKNKIRQYPLSVRFNLNHFTRMLYKVAFNIYTHRFLEKKFANIQEKFNGPHPYGWHSPISPKFNDLREFVLKGEDYNAGFGFHKTYFNIIGNGPGQWESTDNGTIGLTCNSYVIDQAERPGVLVVCLNSVWFWVDLFKFETDLEDVRNFVRYDIVPGPFEKIQIVNCNKRIEDMSIQNAAKMLACFDKT